jgi:hypothetical protein
MGSETEIGRELAIITDSGYIVFNKCVGHSPNGPQGLAFSLGDEKLKGMSPGLAFYASRDFCFKPLRRDARRERPKGFRLVLASSTF